MICWNSEWSASFARKWMKLIVPMTHRLTERESATFICRLVRTAWGWLCTYLMYIHFFFHPPFFSLSFLLLCSFVLCFFLNFLLPYCYNPCFFFVAIRFWVCLPFSLLSFGICAFVYDLFCCLYFLQFVFSYVFSLPLYCIFSPLLLLSYYTLTFYLPTQIPPVISSV